MSAAQTPLSCRRFWLSTASSSLCGSSTGISASSTASASGGSASTRTAGRNSAMPELKLLFLQMLVVLLAARLVAAAFRFIGQPGVVGEMAAGLLLGPSFLGRISPAAMNALFPATGL